MNPDELTAVDAGDIASGVTAPKVEGVTESADPQEFVAGFDPILDQSKNALVKADTEEAEMRDNLMTQIMGVDNKAQDSMSVYQDTFRDEARNLGYRDGTSLQQALLDETTNLARLQGKFRTEEAKIQDMRGTKGAKAGVLGQISHQQAVEVGNQALVVQALQGNYNTARQIALDTAQFASQDRQAELDTLITQFNALDGIVSGQEQQLIDQKKAEAEAEKADLERTQAYIDSALTTGDATYEEMQQLINPKLSGEQKRAVAQAVVSRSAGIDSGLDRAIKGEQLKLARAEREALTAEAEAEGNTQYTESQMYKAREEVNRVAKLADHEGLNTAVGPLAIARVPVADLGGEKKAFIGEVEHMVDVLTLDTYAEAKERGMTFGAMNQGEWDILAKSATAISQWRIRKDDKPDGKVVGYDIDEETFKKELDILTQYAKLGFVLKGGEPSDVGVITAQEDDGTIGYYLKNSVPDENGNTIKRIR